MTNVIVSFQSQYYVYISHFVYIELKKSFLPAFFSSCLKEMKNQKNYQFSNYGLYLNMCV